MGSGCTKGGTAATTSPYDIESGKLLDHFSLGETLGRGAFGVVKAATLKPEAIKALKSIQDGSQLKKQILRRKRFVDQPLAVKVMRQERNAAEGDSCDKLEKQIGRLEVQIQDLEKNMDTGNVNQFEELQWLNEYAESQKFKLSEKRRNQTKKTPRDMMLREVLLLEKCDHRFIMQLVETFEDNSIFCVIFERCYGSVVSRYPDGVFNIDVSARHAYQLLSAVGYLHSHFILHRDIKPENLMFRTPHEDAEVLLGDFGMAVELRKLEDRCQGCAGTPHFVPPEGFHSYYQSFPSDVWACGCTVYWSILGQCPFEVTDADMASSAKKKNGVSTKSFKTTAIFNMWRSTRMGQVLNGWKPQFEHDQTASLARKICHPREEPSFTLPNGVLLANASVIDLLKSMLCKIPKDRVKIDVALKHPWIDSAGREAEKLCSFARPTDGSVLTAEPAVAAKRSNSNGGVKLDQVVPSN
jgi:serine/threonine protein kinase